MGDLNKWIPPTPGEYWSAKPSRRGSQLIKIIGHEERSGVRVVYVERLKTASGKPTPGKRGRLTSYSLYLGYRKVDEQRGEVDD